MNQAHRSIVITIACLSVFLAQLGMMMFLPALPTITLSLHTTEQLTSLALPVYLLGMALPMLFLGKWGARIGLKPVLMMSLVVFAISSTLAALSTHIEIFLSARFTQGLGASGISVMARALVAHHFKGNELANALSLLSTAFVVSIGIGQYAGALLVSTFGWPSLFNTLALGAVVLMAIVYRYLLNSPTLSNTHVCWGNYLTIARHRPFLRAALVGGLGYAIIIAFNTAAPAMFQTIYQWSTNDYGRLGWGMSLAYLLGSLSVSRYVSTLGRTQLSAFAITFMLFASTVMLIGLWATPHAVLLWLPYCLLVFGQAINYPISLSEASEHSPITGPYAMALCGLIHQVLAAVIGVLVSAMGVQEPLWLASICLILAIMVLTLKVTGQKAAM